MRPDLKTQMQRWGGATLARFAQRMDGPSAGDHILAKNRDLAPGTREKAERALIGRDGEDRRRYMAAKSGVRGLKVVPMWACDPIRATNDADAPHERPPSFVDIGLPDDVLWIDSAIRRMAQTHPLRALVVKEEFTGTGTQQAKAARVQSAYGGRLSVWMYRRELERAMFWLEAKQGGQAA